MRTDSAAFLCVAGLHIFRNLQIRSPAGVYPECGGNEIELSYWSTGRSTSAIDGNSICTTYGGDPPIGRQSYPASNLAADAANLGSGLREDSNFQAIVDGHSFGR